MIKERKHTYDTTKKQHPRHKKESTYIIQERKHMYDTTKKAHV